ncbi:hypothetical protein DNL40_07980 [Xylanimonas oleitrophica]|uniref:Serine protease n=1 Tax=Xylanimonas oleitrophica TaxID=2607479 RepID=A0A2W5WQ15_9MICO|nr:hypothetical protein [Xylanimonas oleitrophica]PZR53437.1 hypothetical protein DNL40_07980 [Xylanimonas oleitrophica]
MEIAEAREVKQQLSDYARELGERYGAVTPYTADATSSTSSDVDRAPTLALGIAPAADGGYAVAVRYRLGVPSARAVVRKVAAEAGARADVRRTGRIRTLADVRPRPPVVRAQASGETGRVRPLRPGVSIANVAVTAGTLGAFVVEAGSSTPQVLSNWHVLAGSTTAAAGDVVVQPGPADGGQEPRDRVGTLGRLVPLEPGRSNLVDAALAVLDDGIEVDLDHPVGRVTTTAQALGGEAVAKIGRTTALTRGRVTAIELDDVLVGYGDDLGVLGFDGQVEVEPTGTGPFSRGGDSGSLVYREDGVALGLLFAGSETGGSNGAGLTYVNPIDTVLDALGVRLAG